MALISLAEWAKKNKIDSSTARQKVLRGKLEAFKIGNQWVIDENTPNIDHRANGLSERHKKKMEV